MVTNEPGVLVEELVDTIESGVLAEELVDTNEPEVVERNQGLLMSWGWLCWSLGCCRGAGGWC